MSVFAVAAPQSVNAYANLTGAISKVQLSASGNSQVAVTISAATGTLFDNFGSGSGPGTITINGSFQQVVNALARRDYLNSASGRDTITVTAVDQNDQSSAATSIGVVVRPATNFTTLDDPISDPNSANGINNAGQIIGNA